MFWCDILIWVPTLFFQKLINKMQMTLFQISRDSVCLRMGDRKGKVISKLGPGKEFDSQNKDLKIIVYLRIWTTNICPVRFVRYTILFRSEFWDHNSFPVPTFKSELLFRSHVLRYTFLFQSPFLRHTLSLEILEKCHLHFIY